MPWSVIVVIVTLNNGYIYTHYFIVRSYIANVKVIASYSSVNVRI